MQWFSFQLVVGLRLMVNLTDINEFLVDDPVNWGRMFIAPWVNLLGSFFWGGFIMVVGMAIYLKTERIEPMIAWFIITAALGSTVFPDNLLYLLGVLSGVGVGFLLYQLFISTRE